MARVKNIFLDLEGTLIDDWDSMNLLSNQVDAVKTLLKNRNVNAVHIFSFAIHNAIDIMRFEDELKPRLESRLGVKILSTPCMIEMKEADEKWRKCRLFDMNEFIILRGKRDAFESWVSLNHAGEESTLIDDVVQNMHMHDTDSGTEIFFQNVARTVELWEIWGDLTNGDV